MRRKYLDSNLRSPIGRGTQLHLLSRDMWCGKCAAFRDLQLDRLSSRKSHLRLWACASLQRQFTSQDWTGSSTNKESPFLTSARRLPQANPHESDSRQQTRCWESSVRQLIEKWRPLSCQYDAALFPNSSR